MVTQQQLGVGAGGASLGLVGAEVIQQSVENGTISQQRGTQVAGAVGAGTLGLAGASAVGLVPLGTEMTAGLAGAGLGSSAWFLARRNGVAPRLVIQIPNEVNLIGPVIAGAVFGAVFLAGDTLIERGSALV